MSAPYDPDPFTEGDRLYLLDEDLAAQEIAEVISEITFNEVDGDGTPWTIVLDHLSGIAATINEMRDRFPDLDTYLTDEYCWVRPTPVQAVDEEWERLP